MPKTFLYARVSTLDQTLTHQRTQAEAAGFVIDEVIEDKGQSGLTTKLLERDGGRRLKDKLRADDTVVVRWVDRLGRDYRDVTDNIREFMRMGVTVRTVINNMTFDGATKDPMQQAVRDALIAFMAATAQANAEATKEAQRAGIANTLAGEPEKYRGRRPSFDREKLQLICNMLSQGAGASAIAAETGLTRQTILRVRANPAAAEVALAKWGG